MRRIIGMMIMAAVLLGVAFGAGGGDSKEASADYLGNNRANIDFHTYTGLYGYCETRAGPGKIMPVDIDEVSAQAVGCVTTCSTPACWKQGSFAAVVLYTGTSGDATDLWIAFRSLRKSTQMVCRYNLGTCNYYNLYWGNKSAWPWGPAYHEDWISFHGSPCYDVTGASGEPDGFVSGLDFFAVMGRFGQSKAHPDWDESMDVISDGYISSLDFFAVLSQHQYDCTLNPY